MSVVDAKPDVVPQETMSKLNIDKEEPLSKSVKIIPITNQTRELQTIIREK